MERFVGIDVAQAELVVAVRPDGGTERWANAEAEWTALAARLGELAPALIVLEGTGGLEAGVAAALHDAALPVVVVNPRQVRAFARGVGQQAKTDPIDAAVLARFAEVVRPAPRLRADAAARDLRALVTRRRQVRDMRTAERHRAGRAATAVQPSLERMLAALTAELARLDAAIAAALAADPRRTEATRVLRSAPGVGPVIAATLLAELPELGRGEVAAVAALAGLAPITAQSGRSGGHATIAGGRAPARTALYLAAVTAVRCDPTIRLFYERLLAQHKPRKVALIACAHKLLRSLHAMLRDGALWTTASCPP